MYCLVPTTRPTQPPYLGPPTYKPTYKPGFHLTPTPLPQFPTTSTTTKSTTPNPYRPTFKPAVLATFKPTLPWFSTTPKDEETTTPRYTLPTYPFPILPQFDPSTTTSSSFLVAEMITTTTSTTTTAIPPTESTTEPSSIGIAGLPDSVGLPSSPEAFIFYLETLLDQIRFDKSFSGIFNLNCFPVILLVVSYHLLMEMALVRMNMKFRVLLLHQQ